MNLCQRYWKEHRQASKTCQNHPISTACVEEEIEKTSYVDEEIGIFSWTGDGGRLSLVGSLIGGE